MSLIPKTKWGRWAYAGIGSLALLLTACGTSTQASSGKAPTSITLVGDVASSPSWWFSITPVSFNSTSNFGTDYMYQGLLWVNSHDVINFKRSIAESITVSNDDQTYTVKMNPKWHWSDGHPVTAADAVYAWELAHWSSLKGAPWIDSNVGSHSFDEIQSATVLGPYEFSVNMVKPVSPLYAELSSLGYFSPVPKFAVDKYSNPNQELSWLVKVGVNPNNPLFKIVDGPYDVSKVIKNDYFVMTANPNYDGHKPTIKTVIFQGEQTSAGEFAGLKTGLFAQALIPNSYYTAGKGLTGYVEKPVPYNFGFSMIQPNYSSQAPAIGGLFNKLYIRQAMQMGIDQPGIISALYHGDGVPEWAPVPRLPSSPFYDTATKGYAYDPAKGLALMESHGWKLNSNHVLTRNGVTMAFTMLTSSGQTTLDEEAQLEKADWAKEGFDVTLELIPFDTLITDVTTPTDAGKWTLADWGGWSTGIGFPPLSLYETGAANNFGGYSNAHLNALAASAYQPGTPAQIYQRIHAYDLYSAQQLPVLLEPETTSPYQVVKPWLHGVIKYSIPIDSYQEIWRWTTSPTS
jgi:peptide/nickel transport system substrate-binding protein